MTTVQDLIPNFVVTELCDKIERRNYNIGIIGLGYVGLPLALVAVNAGFEVIGFDIDVNRVTELNAGRCSIKHINTEAIKQAVERGKFRATTEFSELSIPDALMIAVPTPLNRYREPDLSFVENSARQISKYLRPEQLIVLESTTWPGTTAEVMRPILESSGLIAGNDFYLAFSPEREDPGNMHFGTATIPKVVGADDINSRKLVDTLYRSLVVTTVPVSTAATAEAVKLTENIFRSVNIALVNELKMIFDQMGIDVWEVIEAAKSKPFGYMPFYPGPGLGGHCIPIDPFYLTWKAREFETTTKFIELAGQINTSMPQYVIDRLALALDSHTARGLKDAKILLVGMAYKKNIDDMRESPSLKLLQLLERRGSHVAFHDPYIIEIPPTREHAELAGRLSVPLSENEVRRYDAVLVSCDHDAIDWSLIAHNARLIVDTRNVFARKGLRFANIVKA